jgi:hypothetical protein
MQNAKQTLNEAKKANHCSQRQEKNVLLMVLLVDSDGSFGFKMKWYVSNLISFHPYKISLLKQYRKPLLRNNTGNL